MAETPNLTPSEFERGYETFQAREARDAMYKTATFLVGRFWGQPKDMTDGMGVLLLTWNQAFYRYGSFDFALLEEALRVNMTVVEELRPRDIQSLVEADEPRIKRLFLAFLDALRIKEGKKKDCKSPVAVAKALHLLAPNFLPLWDDKIARAYDCYYNVHPDQRYVAFAYKMRALARQLQEHVPADFGRTFLKLIDEYNYAKYTKGWIQPMTATSQKPKTLLEAVRDSLAHARRYDPGDVVAPAAVLWTDADGQWRPLVEQLRGLMPELLTLGDYGAETRTGPAIWLRCVIEPAVRADKFHDLAWPAGAVPVIYMPGVSRQTLRAVDECPDALKPLVELQYRGTVWTQKNGKDWTVRAFLVSDDGGLGLDVAEDKLTLQAMQGALAQLALTRVARLRGEPPKRLEAEDFDRLMIGDTPRDLLLWLGDPEGARVQWDEGTWSAFCNRCRQDYSFNPETDGEIVGGEKLGLRNDVWYGVWERFAESPALYPGIPDLLRRAKPRGELLFDKEPWPDENDSMENALRAALVEVSSMKPAEARRRLGELEAEHGPRRGWAWARLGMGPLAKAMEHLAALAKQTVAALGGDSAETMAKLYAGGGYLADDSALRALACVKTAEDVTALQAAVRCVYLSWLEDSSRHFQKCLAVESLPTVAQQEGIKAAAGECILFADGLRFDIGQRFVAMAGEHQLEVSAAWRWAAMPTVTATAKPAASPVAGRLRGEHLQADFCPELVDTGEGLNTERFRKLLAAAGFQVFGPAESGDARAKNARGWTEYGEFDKLGHDLQGKLAARIEDQLELLLERVQGLLEGGWKRVRVVTDHGWLLVPGGMPKVQLPKYLAESRWSRCASIKDSSQVEVPIAGWSWNAQERFAYAPGIHSFVAGQEYAHGGASLQECLVPVLTFASTRAPAGVVVTVREVQWVGLRCRVIVEPATEGLSADLRTKPNVPDSSIAQPKALDADGKVALLVADESLEGTMASLVIIDASGRVVCKDATTVGGDK